MVDVTLAAKIQGWMSLGELRFLAEHASKSNIILEAGCYKGRSTRAMADNTKGIIHAIDPWDGHYEGYENFKDEAQKFLKKDASSIRLEFYLNLFDHLVDGKVIMNQIPFHKFNPSINPNMIFIDANHAYEAVKRDILHAISLMPHGGLLCGHDYCGEWLEVCKAVDEVFGRGISTEETIWWINL
jgi:hypothetical protein